VLNGIAYFYQHFTANFQLYDYNYFSNKREASLTAKVAGIYSAILTASNVENQVMDLSELPQDFLLVTFMDLQRQLLLR
jgi:hypothetical protein